MAVRKAEQDWLDVIAFALCRTDDSLVICLWIQLSVRTIGSIAATGLGVVVVRLFAGT